jgi:hypothetical protein
MEPGGVLPAVLLELTPGDERRPAEGAGRAPPDVLARLAGRRIEASAFAVSTWSGPQPNAWLARRQARSSRAGRCIEASFGHEHDRPRDPPQQAPPLQYAVTRRARPSARSGICWDKRPGASIAASCARPLFGSGTKFGPAQADRASSLNREQPRLDPRGPLVRRRAGRTAPAAALHSATSSTTARPTARYRELVLGCAAPRRGVSRAGSPAARRRPAASRPRTRSSTTVRGGLNSRSASRGAPARCSVAATPVRAASTRAPATPRTPPPARGRDRQVGIRLRHSAVPCRHEPQPERPAAGPAIELVDDLQRRAVGLEVRSPSVPLHIERPQPRIGPPGDHLRRARIDDAHWKVSCSHDEPRPGSMRSGPSGQVGRHTRSARLRASRRGARRGASGLGYMLPFSSPWNRGVAVPARPRHSMDGDLAPPLRTPGSLDHRARGPAMVRRSILPGCRRRGPRRWPARAGGQERIHVSTSRLAEPGTKWRACAATSTSSARWPVLSRSGRRSATRRR